MRQLYKSVIEQLKAAMRQALNGRDPPCNLPPHWSHGDKMPDQVMNEHKQKWAKFYDGSWVKEWRVLNNFTYVPSREELLEVMDPWLHKFGYPVPRLQALRGGCSRYSCHQSRIHILYYTLPNACSNTHMCSSSNSAIVAALPSYVALQTALVLLVLLLCRDM